MDKGIREQGGNGPRWPLRGVNICGTIKTQRQGYTHFPKNPTFIFCPYHIIALLKICSFSLFVPPALPYFLGHVGTWISEIFLWHFFEENPKKIQLFRIHAEKYCKPMFMSEILLIDWRAIYPLIHNDISMTLMTFWWKLWSSFSKNIN